MKHVQCFEVNKTAEEINSSLRRMPIHLLRNNKFWMKVKGRTGLGYIYPSVFYVGKLTITDCKLQLHYWTMPGLSLIFMLSFATAALSQMLYGVIAYGLLMDSKNIMFFALGILLISPSYIEFFSQLRICNKKFIASFDKNIH